MSKDYEIEFQNEISRILEQIYYDPINKGSNDKRLVVDTQRNYLQYLIKNKLVKTISTHGNKVGLVLEQAGYEVFEKYDGWFDYKRKVIDKQQKIENAKGLATRFWWIPVIISLLAMGVAVIALFF